jgi:hypothetical protein
MQLWGVGFLALTLIVWGCGKKEEPTPPKGGDGKGSGDSNPPAKRGPKEPLQSKGTGTLKGKVTFAGDPPQVQDLEAQMKEKLAKSPKDLEICLKDKQNPSWVTGADNGVANVVVWVKPADPNKFFKVPQELIDKVKDKQVVMEQPGCAFIPHVMTLFPTYYDPAAKDPRDKQVKTGQTFRVTNTAPFLHNTNTSASRLSGGNQNKALGPGSHEDLFFRPGYNGEEEKVTFSCNVHPWMSAYAWAFDHPYAAVTDKDGNFEIKDVPAGAELDLMVWHERSDGGGKQLKKPKMTLKEGENTEDIKLDRLK